MSVSGVQKAIARLSSLSGVEQGVADLSLSEKRLYIDALNFNWGLKCPPRGAVWNLREAEANIEDFLSAAKVSGFEKVVVFIDGAAPSDEASSKWLKRRRREVRVCQREVPQGLSVFLGRMFERNGVEVHFSLEMDCDDTLAIFAPVRRCGRFISRCGYVSI